MGRTKRLTACLFICFIFCQLVHAQDVYFVTFVKGDIRKSDATKIKVGDKLLFQEKVIFSNKDCKLILLHPQKGRFILEPGSETQQPTGEYFVYLKTSLHLSNEKLKLSSRGNGDISLDEFFTVNPSINKNLLFIGETKISLANSNYRINDPANDFFFLQLTPPSGKPINHKLVVVNDSLLINKADFLFDGKEPEDNVEIKLGFIQNYSTEKKLTKISSFDHVYMTIDDCKAIMNTIKQSIGNDRDKIIEETMTQFYYNYGKPDKNTVSSIYNNL